MAITTINYGKLGIEASDMKSDLEIFADKYVNYRASLYLYNKYKKKYPSLTKPIVEPMFFNDKTVPITLWRIEFLQVEMNKIRRQVGLKPFNMIARINKRIAKYKRSKYGKV